MSSITLPDKTTVLVVGAGPVGLSCALSLLEHGCSDFVIVDAIPAGLNLARAAAIHSATLEALDTVGCADSLVELGIPATTLKVNNRTNMHPVVQADFSAALTGKTKFPFVLALPQNVTERVLTEHLAARGVQVRRPYKVAGLKEVDDGMEVSFESGECIKTKYVVGADGSRSTVRTLAGIKFATLDDKDPDASYGLVFADALLATPSVAPPSSLLCPGHNFIMMPVPMLVPPESVTPGVAAYRIVCSGLGISDSTPKEPSMAYIQDLIDKHGPTPPPRLVQVLSATRYQIRFRVAEKFFTRLGNQHAEDAGDSTSRGGVVLLVGDAAHIHSPIGGQGMNLGIRDAVTLGRVLAVHAKSSVDSPHPDTSLSEWASLRRRFALATVQATKTMSGAWAVPKPHPIMEAIFQCLPFGLWGVRMWTLEMLSGIGYVRRALAWRLSGLEEWRLFATQRK
ncbi:hypothetical protein PLICRDRAFT_687604 [Plicaturopsis crispa FD-325 SS-3]|nr:hypothetical protein PLICRDRAFT_687604 [Plicaturopsis crispa FD-325 SS-3]